MDNGDKKAHESQLFKMIARHNNPNYKMPSEIIQEQAIEITTLRAKVAELEKQNEWISVKDRLPEIKQEILCYAFDNYFNAVGDKSYSGGIKRKAVNNEWIADHRITHWMKLPKPPKD